MSGKTNPYETSSVTGQRQAKPIHAKPRLSQVNVRQNLFGTQVEILGLPVTMTGNFCQTLLYINDVTGKN